MSRILKKKKYTHIWSEAFKHVNKRVQCTTVVVAEFKPITLSSDCNLLIKKN